MSVSPPTTVNDFDIKLTKSRQAAAVTNSAPTSSFCTAPAGLPTAPKDAAPSISLVTKSAHHEKHSSASGTLPQSSSPAAVDSKQPAHTTTPISTPVTTMNSPPPVRFLLTSPQQPIPGAGTPRTTTPSTPASTPLPADAKSAPHSTNPEALTLTATAAMLTSPSTPRKSKGGRRAVNPNLTEEQRRQERVLKNRESAMKSLQKKKRYTQNLEHRAIALAARNNELRDKIRLLLDRLNSLHSSQASNFSSQALPNNPLSKPLVSMPTPATRIPYGPASTAAVAAAAAAAAAMPVPTLKPQALSHVYPSLSSSSLPPPPAPPVLQSSGASQDDWGSGLVQFAHPPPDLQTDKSLFLDTQDAGVNISFPLCSIPESPCPSKDSSV